MALELDEANPCATMASLRTVYANIIAGMSRQ